MAPRRVVFVLLDAVRADRLSVYGYERQTTPALDSLAEGGVVARSHFAHDSQTRASLPQMLYSRYFTPSIFPDNDKVPLEEPWNLFQDLDREAISLPRALAAAGFRTAALSAHAWLQPGTPFAAEFDELHRLGDEVPVNPFYRYPNAGQMTDAAITWLDGHRKEDVFLYLHYMDTHFPHPWGPEAQDFAGPGFDVDAARRAFTPEGRMRDEGQRLTPSERRYLDALYDGGLRHADGEVGRLVDYLRRQGWLDDTLIVVTSDHGEHLGEIPGRFEHGGPWYEVMAHVPWIVHYPRRLHPVAYDGLTGAIDVMPTVLALLEVPLPASARTDGIDLSTTFRGGKERNGGSGREAIYSPHGVRDERFHLVLPDEQEGQPTILLAEPTPPEPDQVHGMLFDVAGDPLETHDLWDANPEVVRELLASWHATLRRPYSLHVRSRRDGPPEASFAIAVRHAAIESSTAVVESDGAPMLRDDDRRWQRNNTWNAYWLGAAPGAPAVELGFELPAGAYELRAAVAGACRLTVGDGPAVELTGPADGALLRRAAPIPQTDARPYGSIRLEESRFRATLEVADGNSPCLLRYLGFTPAGVADQTGDSAEADERLRALGYVD